MADGAIFIYTEIAMYRYYNPNPDGIITGDCVVRALSKAFCGTWVDVYATLCQKGLKMADMPSANRVWGACLKDHGFARHNLPDTCPDCYTIRLFCADHPSGVYIAATGTHVVCVIDGNYYDAWDSGNEVPTYYWRQDE